jgi:hypothetical protein
MSSWLDPFAFAWSAKARPPPENSVVGGAETELPNPAVPGALTPVLTAKPNRPFQTLRVSNIPVSIERDAFYGGLVESCSEDNIISYSYESATASILAAKYRVATVTFKDAPGTDELQRLLRQRLARAGSQTSRLRVDSDFFGLTSLHSPPHVQDIQAE